MGAFDSELYALGYRHPAQREEEKDNSEYWAKKGFFVYFQVEGPDYHALERHVSVPTLEEALHLFKEKEKYLKGVRVTSFSPSGRPIIHIQTVYDQERFDAFKRMYSHE